MEDYKTMCFTLFQAITTANEILTQAQIQAEAMFMQAEENTLFGK